MRILTIGDIHGRTSWKEIVKNAAYDKVIFIGDYFDPYESEGIEFNQCMGNFLDILDFKLSNPEVILLLGNHDHHYLHPEDRCSRYDGVHAEEISKLFQDYIDLFKVCFVHNDFIFTHAGVTKTWCEKYKISQIAGAGLEQDMEFLYKNIPSAFSFQYSDELSGWCDPSGDDVFQSPFWVRPQSLARDKIPGTHVVGHTKVKKIVPSPGFVFIDTLATSKEYLIIENNEPKVYEYPGTRKSV